MKEISMDFFRDEVRNGFFIPTVIKQAWAAQLQVLDVIDTICRKHGITYFADWGTILGTVRHGGYVPWDDDLDICMKREDYVRFKEVARTELPEHFCIHDYEHKEDHWEFLARVVNHEHICYDLDHLKEFHNFLYLTAIDIFVLDYLYKDEQKEKQRCEEVKYIIAFADMIVGGNVTPAVKEKNLKKLEQKYHKNFNRRLDARHMGIELYRLAEEQMARVPQEQSDRMAQIFPWGLLGKRGEDKKYYGKFVRLPFENTTMPVPADYHEILSHKYYDYFKIHKVWGGHDYPYFEAQRKSLQAVADFKLPEFTFDRAMLRQNISLTKSDHTMQNTAADALQTIQELHNAFIEGMQGKAGSGLAADDIEHMLNILAQCQDIVIDLGNYIEQMKGEHHPSAKKCVVVLEAYCEKLFHVYNALSGGAENKNLCEELKQAFVQMKQTVEKEIIHKKLVAFLPDDPKRWKEMQKMYDHYKQQENTEVCVIPLPLFTKDPYGEITAQKEENDRNDKREEYPDHLNVIPWTAIQMQFYEFAAIVIQNPYDGENPYLTIPPAYYAKRLQQYTNCLIYMMPQGVNDFTEDDITDVYGLKYSLTMPGAMYADKILIESSAMKELFADHLTAFAGEDTRAVWNEKIEPVCAFLGVENCQETPENRNGQKKTLLYCIGENEFFENTAAALDKVKERLEVMAQYPDRLKVAVCLYPYDIAMWEIISAAEKGEVIQVLKKYCHSKHIEFLETADIHMDDMTAYYGSPSPLICRFVEQHKPAMVSECGCDVTQ